MPRPYRPALVVGLIGSLLLPGGLLARGLTVNGHVTFVASVRKGKQADNSNAVIWLTRLSDEGESTELRNGWGSEEFRLVQKNKQFIPHILVVPAGARVEFPNSDPFFHNVFSLFDGKRFDLGLYEAGTMPKVTFNSPGVSYIFCNIHPEMSAVVIVTKTPYYAVSNVSGAFTMRSVPAGRYRLNVWHERCLPDTLKAMSRVITVSPDSVWLGDLRLSASGDILSKHKNKYGRDYEPTESLNPLYGTP